MTSKIKLKETFAIESKHSAFFTGGNVEWIDSTLFCQTVSTVSVFDVNTGSIKTTIGECSTEDSDVINTFTCDSQNVVTSHKSGLLKLWTHDGQLKKMWKSIHTGPIARLALKDKKLASGGSDGVIRIWDMAYQSCLLALRGAVGVVNVAEFHPSEELVFGSGDDGKICSWPLAKGEVAKVYSAHFSKVISLAFHCDNLHFVSCGRDKVVILWNIEHTAPLRTVPMFEAVETVVLLPLKFKLPNGTKLSSTDGQVHIATAGERGVIRIWDISKSKEVYVQENSLVSKSKEDGGLSIIKLIYNEQTRAVAVVTAEQNIILHDLVTFRCLKQFVGFSDEILDLEYVGKNDSHLAVATNSADIKLYENATMNCQLLKGHTDFVLALSKSAANPNLLLSSGKDNTVRLWSLFESDDGEAVRCVAVGLRHTGSVSCVAFNNLSTTFAVSGSQDTCLKVWQIPDLVCTHTEIAHQKDINCVTVSPNDKIIATASQDKTAKLWTETLQLIGILRGHRRGVWSVQFSPVDQVVMTSSADCTIRLWSIADLSCLKTIEGHESSVLRVEFLSNGMQILSTGGDGLVKLFNVKTSECTSTLDSHEARVWALALQKGENGFITGGSDSVLIKWKDVTEERKQQQLEEQENLILQEQKLANYIQSKQLLKALKLALKLDRPLQTLRIIQQVIKERDNNLADTIKMLRNDQKESLLKCATGWNTNSKNCIAAQVVINILINELQSGEFQPVGLGRTIESLLPYTERHFKRLTQLLQDLHFIQYTIDCMQPHARSSG